MIVNHQWLIDNEQLAMDNWCGEALVRVSQTKNYQTDKVDNSVFEYKRKSYIQKGDIYFWTATINNWQHLLQSDIFKDVIIGSLEYLSKQQKIDVFAFVILPNHIHVIWRINASNGKETAQGSFLKYTAHEFRKLLVKGEGAIDLSNFAVVANNKSHEFWQRDSLAIPLYTQRVAYQKLDYLHLNPLAKHWQLAKDPCEYKYSTARFYEQGLKEFLFIKDLRDEF